MRRSLDWLLRFAVPDDDRVALLGDLEEEYRSSVRPQKSRLGAACWYIGQVIAAAWSFARRGRVRAPPGARRRAWFPADDVRYALRRWRRRPGFPIAATLTLGLGIGAATSMFSVVDAVLLQPLPWLEPERLVAIHAVYPDRRTDSRFATTWNRSPVHVPAWDALRRSTSFTDVAVWEPPSTSMLFDHARTQLAQAMVVSSNFLPTLGARVAHGRNFTREDDEQATWNVILSYETWQRHFGGRTEIIGQPSEIAYASQTFTPPWTVVGVLQPGFSFEGHSPDMLVMIGGNTSSASVSFVARYRAIGRLAPGVSIETASSEASARVQASQPAVAIGAEVIPLAREQLGSSARPLWLLFGAAGILLLVACANVAGLLVGENRTRRHETAIRLALGITPRGIARQLVVEHAILAVAGALTGLALAASLTQGLVAMAPGELPRLENVRVDWRVALFALSAGVVTLLGFGLAPAMSLARTRVASLLADGGREAAPARHVAQRTVVAAEIAMAAVLVVGAGLLGETLFRLLSQPLGFDPSRLAVVETRFTGSNRPPDWISGTRGQSVNVNAGQSFAERTAAIRRARTTAVVDRLSAVPGAVRAAAISPPPFSRSPFLTSVRVDGRRTGDDDRATFLAVSPAVVSTMRMSLRSGRDFERTDGQNVVLVSHAFERRYFPDGAVGHRFESVTGPPLNIRTAYEVIGVVADVKHSTYAEDPVPAVYVVGATESFVLQTAGDPLAVLPSIRGALAEVDPQIVVTRMTTMDSRLAEVVAAERFRATLSSAFAGTALVLAVVGLYGVAANRVADRRRELGIRVALGARPENLQAMVFRDGLQTVCLGLAVGLPAAFAVSQVTRAFLFGVSPTAPHVFALASFVLAAAAIVATLVPARRAGRVDPMLALKD